MLVWLAACATPDPTDPTDPPTTDPTPVEPGARGVEVSAGGPPPVGLADLVVAPDGAVWVSWVAESTTVPNGRDLLVSRSSDGVDFDPPVAIDGALEPSGIWPRIPRLAVGADGALLVAFGTVRASTEAIHVFRAPAGTTTFEPIFERERTLADDAVEILLPVARSGPDGDTWVAWVLADGQTAELWAAREGEAWAEQRVDGGDAEPTCTCCPVDFAVDGDRAIFAWRGGARRELLVAEATDDGYDAPIEISSFGLVFLACPLDGPSIVASEGVFRVIASDTDPGEAALWSIAEQQPGHWGPAEPIPADRELGGLRPSVATDGTTTWLAYEAADHARIAVAEAGEWGAGAPWAPTSELAEPPRIASGGGKTWLVQVANDRSVWVAPVSE